MNLYLLDDISALSSLLPLLFFFGKGKIRRERIFFLLVAVAVFTELISGLMAAKGKHNLWLFTIYTFVEGFLVLLIISQKIETKIAKWIAYGFILILAALTLITLRKPLPNDILNISAAFFVFGFALYYYAYLFQKAHIPVLTQYHFFWINSAFVFYFTVHLLVGGAEHLFQKSTEGHYAFLYAYQRGVNIIYNIVLAIGVWKIGK